MSLGLMPVTQLRNRQDEPKKQLGKSRQDLDDLDAEKERSYLPIQFFIELHRYSYQTPQSGEIVMTGQFMPSTLPFQRVGDQKHPCRSRGQGNLS